MAKSNIGPKIYKGPFQSLDDRELLVDLLSPFIESKHGGAVAEQFAVTFPDASEKTLSGQNPVALEKILASLEEVFPVIHPHFTDELEEYMEDLEKYVKKS